MTHQEIIKRHSQVTQLLLDGSLQEAIWEIELMAEQSEKVHVNDQLSKQKDIYINILQHSFKGYDDPQRDEIYNHVVMRLLEINDSVKEKLLTETSSLSSYKIKWALENKRNIQAEETLSMVKNLTLDKELHDILKENNIQLDEDSDINVSRSESLNRIFQYIWLVDNYQEIELNLVHTICDSEKIPWHDKALIVSAVTMSLFRNFEKSKFLLLFNFFNKKEHQIWQRALVGIVLISYLYKDRLVYYPEILEKIEELKQQSDYRKNIDAILIQLIKTKETEKLTKKWEEEILPEMMKMQSKIEKKLDIENILSDKFIEDKNPDWEVVFEDSPDLLDKLQEFSEMQIQGSDVFMSAFSKLKHFPFFNSIANWFVPFYKESEAVQEVFASESNSSIMTIIERMEKSHFMCNSDKYSFCLNLQMVPDSHKASMMEMFNAEMQNLSEISDEDELLDDSTRDKSIYTQYLQDLYRFFKLYPSKNEFLDVFKLKLDIYNTELLKPTEDYKEILRNIAEFQFSKNQFDLALELFKSFESNEETNIELFEKIAYCYQRMGDYENALNYYLKADLLDANKAWVSKKIAMCYRYLEQHENALKYYKEAEKQEPDNLYIQAYIGHSLLSLKQYDEALKYYFKVEYLAPSNQKIQRPIAWISFVVGKFDTAENYLLKLITAEKSRLDYLSLGHVYWCQGKEKEAIKYYRDSFEKYEGNIKLFASSFREEEKILLSHGIQKRDIALMLDYLKLGNI